MENKNKIFYNFLAKYAPHLSKKFRKTKEGLYKTFPSIKKAGEVYVFNPNKMEIIRSYLQTVYIGGAYEKELATQIYKIKVA